MKMICDFISFRFLVNGDLKSKYGLRGAHEEIDNSYIEKSLEEILAPDISYNVCYEYNIPKTTDLLKNEYYDGLIIPQGAGDTIALSCIEKGLGKRLDIPIFEAYKHLGEYARFYMNRHHSLLSAMASINGLKWDKNPFQISAGEKQSKNKQIEKAFKRWLKENFK